MSADFVCKDSALTEFEAGDAKDLGHLDGWRGATIDSRGAKASGEALGRQDR